jgi:hypothetical protein
MLSEIVQDFAEEVKGKEGEWVERLESVSGNMT